MNKPATDSKIFFSGDLKRDLTVIIQQHRGKKILLATETTVEKLWGHLWKDPVSEIGAGMIVLPSGEENKNIESVIEVWRFLSNAGADRKSLLINIGGGMLTDIAGFAASTFKRGIEFINVPTTLLSQVDASVGGKTGINFNGLKNEVGTFQEASSVIIDTMFLTTLDERNFRSGFAEMIKHGLIKSPEHLAELEIFNIEQINYHLLGEIIKHSVAIKEFFVKNDPTEKNIRKALNFGHTAGHAFESLAMEKKQPVLHGYAVAWGMIAEIFLSVEKCGFDRDVLYRISSWIRKIYGNYELEKDEFPELIRLMTHDKKNEAGRINFTLLKSAGEFAINQDCSHGLIVEALRFCNDLK